MVQTAVPISDTTITNWSQLAGDGDEDAFDELDEGIPGDDGTTAWDTEQTGTNLLRCRVTTVTDPEVSTGHTVRVRCQKSAAAGRTLDLTITLFDSGGTIFTDIANTDVLNGWTTFTHNLSGAEADSITSYATLDVQVQIIEQGGGQPRNGEYSAADFECPDAAAGVSLIYNPQRIQHVLNR